MFSGPVTTFHAGKGNIVLKPLRGDHSILVTDEDRHLRVRKLLMPAVNGAAPRAADDGDEKALEAVIKEAMRLRPVIGEADHPGTGAGRQDQGDRPLSYRFLVRR